MKKLSSLLLLAGTLAFVLNPAVSLAGCGSCGAHAKRSGHAHAATVGEQATLLCGCPATEQSIKMHQQKNLIEMAKHAGSFNTLVKAIEAAGLVETLQGEGPYTVFAPSDEAFAKLPEGELDKLLKDKDKLRALLTYHVHPGLKSSAEVVKLSSLETINGQKANVAVEACGVMIDHSTVTTTDIKCSNGVIHVIDKVLLPKELTS
jgi:uncharacterized surface protein with fasciclin (FAS1) repeats